MIDASASLRAARTVSASALINYLRMAGWKLGPSKLAGVAIASLPVAGADDLWVPVPLDERFPDHQDRKADILRTLAAIENRPEAMIAETICGSAISDGGIIAAE